VRRGHDTVLPGSPGEMELDRRLKWNSIVSTLLDVRCVCSLLTWTFASYFSRGRGFFPLFELCGCCCCCCCCNFRPSGSLTCNFPWCCLERGGYNLGNLSCPVPSLPLSSVLLSGDETTFQVGIIKTMGRAPGEGLGLPDGHDPVPTREEGLRKRGLVYRHFEGEQSPSVSWRTCFQPPTLDLNIEVTDQALFPCSGPVLDVDFS